MNEEVVGGCLSVAYKSEVVTDAQQMWVVVVDEDCTLIVTQEVVEFTFGTDDTLERTESFEVGTTHVGDESVVGTDDFNEGFDFARMVGSHLNDGYVVVFCKLKEGLGYPDMVVEITLGIKHVVFLL